MHIVYVHCVRFGSNINRNNSDNSNKLRILYLVLWYKSWSHGHGSECLFSLVLWHVHCAHIRILLPRNTSTRSRKLSRHMHVVHPFYRDLSNKFGQMILIHVDTIYFGLHSLDLTPHIFRLTKTFTTFSRDLRGTENVTRRLIQSFVMKPSSLSDIFSFQNPWNMMSILEWTVASTGCACMHAACEMKKAS